MMETLKDKDCQELRFNVLLGQSTNFQHTSLLQCSLKLKLHRLKAYKPLYRRSFGGGGMEGGGVGGLLRAIPAFLLEPVRRSKAVTL